MAAFMLEVTSWEILGIVALATMLVGVRLNWRRQWDIAELEEGVKNGKITVDQAWRRSRFIHRRATTVIVCGIAMVCVFMIGLAV